MGKQSAQSKDAKKPGKVTPTTLQMVAYCVACFSDYVSAVDTLENAKALFDAARIGLRTELKRAHDVIGDGRPWDKFKAQLRAGLVNGKVSNTPAAAGRLINNALIALGLTGKGTNGKTKPKLKPNGGGRPEQEDTGAEHNVTDDAPNRLLAVLQWFGEMQAKYQGDQDILDDFARGAALLGANAKVRKTRKARSTADREMIAKALRL